MLWFCLDCRLPTELDRHGYCARCGSDAVVPDRKVPGDQRPVPSECEQDAGKEVLPPTITR